MNECTCKCGQLASNVGSSSSGSKSGLSLGGNARNKLRAIYKKYSSNSINCYMCVEVVVEEPNCKNTFHMKQICNFTENVGGLLILNM